MVIVSNITTHCFTNNFHSGMRSQPICGCLWHHLCYCCCYKKTEEAKFEKNRFILELSFRNVFMFILLHCVVTVMRKRIGCGGVKPFTSLVPKSKNERKGLGGKHPLATHLLQWVPLLTFPTSKEEPPESSNSVGS